jgi:hypothetical protein
MTLSLPVAAEEIAPFTSMCVPISATGFKLIKGKWVQTNFKTENFFLKKVMAIPKEPAGTGHDRVEWFSKYWRCESENKDKESVLVEEFEEGPWYEHPICILHKYTGSAVWEGGACTESDVQSKKLDKDPVIRCDLTTPFDFDIEFRPDGMYLKKSSFTLMADDVKEELNDYQQAIVEMGRCSVISEE